MSFFLDKNEGPAGPLSWVFEKDGQLTSCQTRVAALDTGGAGKMVESVGSGYLPPHQASVARMKAEVRYAAGIDSGMIPMQG